MPFSNPATYISGNTVRLFNKSAYLFLEDSGGNNTLSVYHDGNNALFQVNNYGAIVLGLPNQPTNNTVLFTRNGSNSFHIRPDVTNQQIVFCPVSTNGGNQIVIGSSISQDYDHVPQTNPTLYVHSNTVPDGDNTEWIGLTHNVTNPVISWGKGELVLTGPTASLTLTKTGGTDLADAIVKPTTLKTTTGEVSSTGANQNSIVLPGGEYGFYPQIKSTSGDTNQQASIYYPGASGAALSTSYQTLITLKALTSQTIYAQQRYVTASGQDHWLFLLTVKATGEILAAYSAPDHPCYGNGNDPEKVKHPFASIVADGQEVVVVDKATVSALKSEAEATGKTLLAVVNENYCVETGKEEIYEPLHLGYFTEKLKMVDAVVADYIPEPTIEGKEPTYTKTERVVSEEKIIKEPVMLAALPGGISVRKLKRKV